MKLRKLTAGLLCMSVLAGTMAGCSSQAKTEPAATTEAAQKEETSEKADETAGESKEEEAKTGATRTITDHTGVQVEIPENPERIVISSILPLPSVYCLYRGSVEGLVGMHPSSMAAAQNSYLTTVYPEIEDVDTSFVEGGEVNIEQLMNLKPDVVFYNASNAEERQMYDNAGITAVGFSTTMADFNTIETYANWIDLLGQIFGGSEKADEIIEYGRSVEAAVLEKTKELPEGEKPRVLILFNYANGIIKTSGSKFFGQYWIDSAGGINVAKDLTGQAEINMEQIYEWDPDMIFITNFAPVLPEDLYNNAIEGNDWSNVKAVREKQVYKFPLGMYRWFPPSSDTPLSLMWLAKTIQPKLFEDIDMDQEIKDYYKKYYNEDLTDEDLYTIYHPTREAAGV
ncbi:ABC transporter substrate-binding protein [Lachnospiraceae bacterium 54-53]